jgi:hypothetical protein
MWNFSAWTLTAMVIGLVFVAGATSEKFFKAGKAIAALAMAALAGESILRMLQWI